LRADVLVIGAGPAGGSLSFLLARAGLNVLMIDSKRFIGKKSCSGILGYKCLEELPVNVDPFVVSEIKTGIFESPGGVKIRFEGRIAKVVDRVHLDREIIDVALSNGAKIRTGCRFVGIENEKAIILGENGYEKISFKYLVGADGVYSKVRDVLGWKTEAPYLGIQVFSNKRISPEEGFIAKIKRGSRFLWIYPWGDRSRVGVLGKRIDPLMEWIREIVPSFTGKEVAAIPSMPLKSFHKGNVALVGDAAGQVKPLSRGGVYLGVKGAKLLASSIIDSYERDLPVIEDSYERMWWRLFGFEIKAGLAFRKVLDRMNPRELDSIFSSLRDYEAKISSFDIDHQLSSALMNVGFLERLKIVLSRPKFFIRLLHALISCYLTYL